MGEFFHMELSEKAAFLFLKATATWRSRKEGEKGERKERKEEEEGGQRKEEGESSW